MGNKKNRKSHPNYNASRRNNKRCSKHDALHRNNGNAKRKIKKPKGDARFAAIENHRSKIRTRQLSSWQIALTSEELIYSNWTNENGKFDLAIRKIKRAFEIVCHFL